MAGATLRYGGGTLWRVRSLVWRAWWTGACSLGPLLLLLLLCWPCGAGTGIGPRWMPARGYGRDGCRHGDRAAMDAGTGRGDRG